MKLRLPSPARVESARVERDRPELLCEIADGGFCSRCVKINREKFLPAISLAPDEAALAGQPHRIRRRTRLACRSKQTLIWLSPREN
jgi:hypothetical protein